MSNTHEIANALACIAAAGRPGYQTWLELLSATCNECGPAAGSSLMIDAFGEDRPGETLRKTKSVLGTISIGTVFYHARQCGYKPQGGTKYNPTLRKLAPRTKGPAPIPAPLPYTAFGFREQVIGGIHNRGTVLPIYNLTHDFGRLKCEGYHSLFLHPVDFLQYSEEKKLHTGKASIAGYAGPCWVDSMQVDIDDSDLDKALAVARKWAEAFPEADYYFTGSKGFRAAFAEIFPDNLNGKFDTPAECCKIVKGIALRVAGNIDCIDLGIYDCTRLIRIPNSRHPKTGLFQIHLSAEEICTLSITEIKALAVAPRYLHTLESKSEPICL